MESFLLQTKRMQLRSATPELAAADLNDRSRFARLLGAEVPEHWPPPLNDKTTQTYTLDYLEQNPDAAGWSAWYFLLPDKQRPARAIGIGGFTGKPSAEGTVELGYSILPDHQRFGFASEAVAAMVKWAFSHLEVQLVTGQTFPELVGSIRVMEKNGFRFLGGGSEERVVRYGRERS